MKEASPASKHGEGGEPRRTGSTHTVQAQMTNSQALDGTANAHANLLMGWRSAVCWQDDGPVDHHIEGYARSDLQRW